MYYQNLKAPKSRRRTQQIIGSPVAKRQPAIKGKKQDHWFLVLGVGSSPRLRECVLVLRALVLCTVLEENWLPANDALLDTLVSV